jgi:hypothetical protein
MKRKMRSAEECAYERKMGKRKNKRNIDFFDSHMIWEMGNRVKSFKKALHDPTVEAIHVEAESLNKQNNRRPGSQTPDA